MEAAKAEESISFRANVKLSASTPLCYKAQKQEFGMFVILYKIPFTKFLFLPVFAHSNMLLGPKLRTSGSILQCSTVRCSNLHGSNVIPIHLSHLLRSDDGSLKATSRCLLLFTHKSHTYTTMLMRDYNVCVCS